MAIPQTDVIGPLVLPDGTAPFGARLKFELVKWDKDSGETILMGPVFADCDAAGDFTVSLWPSSEGVNSTSYAVSATYYNGGQDKVITEVLGFISVPELGPVLLADLLTVTATPITTPEGLALMAAYLAAAEVAEANAAAAAAIATAAVANIKIEYNTLSAMVADPALTVGAFVKTLGYFTAGDGGGSVYEIVAAGTSTADGGLYIDLTGSSLQAKGVFAGRVTAEQMGYDAALENWGAAVSIAWGAGLIVTGLSNTYVTSSTAVATAGSGFVGDGEFSTVIKRAAGFVGVVVDTSAYEAALAAGDPDVVNFAKPIFEGFTILGDGLPLASEALNVGDWRNQKHLLSSDWQPRADGGELVDEVARHRANLDSISKRHPDLTHAHVLGDLIDKATENNTGAPPPYGFPEFFSDWVSRLRVPLSRSFFLGGNHDRDGTGAGLHEKAWSMRTYKEWCGKLYYSTTQGNLINIYLSDMGGTTGGYISDEAVAWFLALAKRNHQANIILNIHQPIGDTYQGFNESNDTDKVQAASIRLQNALTDIAAGPDNIVAVFYGHVGSGFQFNDETAFGARHIQIGMHIPSNVDLGRNDQYYVMNLKHGATSFTVDQWDATADVLLSSKSISWKKPLQLAEEFAHDGRYDRAEMEPVDGPITITQPLSDHRVWDGAAWVVNTSKRKWGVTYRITDDAKDTVPIGFEMGYSIDFPGGFSATDTADLVAVEGTALNGLGNTWIKLDASEKEPTLGQNFYCADGGNKKLMATLYPSAAPQDGYHLKEGRLRVDGGDVGNAIGGAVDPTVAAFIGFQANPNGQTYVGTSTLPTLHLSRTGNNGDVVRFYRNSSGAAVGSVSVTGTTTAFNTTSDERLKMDLQEFDGLAVIMGLGVYDYAWVADGSRGRGVMAQEAHNVAPYAVSVGEDGPDGEVVMPWTVDYSKLVPDLIRAVQQLEKRLADLGG